MSRYDRIIEDEDDYFNVVPIKKYKFYDVDEPDEIVSAYDKEHAAKLLKVNISKIKQVKINKQLER